VVTGSVQYHIAGHCCGQDILHVTQMGCKTTNFGCFHGNTANKGFCTVRIDLQNAVVILVLCFATLQNKLATAVGGVHRQVNLQQS